MSAMTFKTKAERSAHYNATVGVVYLTVAGKEFGYYVDPLASDWGRAWTLTKFLSQRTPGEPDAYAVLINPKNDQHSCECKGWLRHRVCKHVAGCLALHGAGKLS